MISRLVLSSYYDCKYTSALPDIKTNNMLDIIYMKAFTKTGQL